MDAGARHHPVMRLGDQEVDIAARRDLRAMRDDEQLRAPRQPCQPIADRARHRAADAAINLVENHRRRAALFGKRDLECENEARQFAAACNFGKRAKRCARVGRHGEFDALHPVGAPLRFVERRYLCAELRSIELERREFARDRAIEPQRCRAPCLTHRLGKRDIGRTRPLDAQLERD